MLRQFFVIVVVMALGWLLRRVFGAPAVPAPRTGGAPEQSGAEMVRDRVCNTFLPRSSALSSNVEGQQHFFCSERCRQAFLERL